MKGTYINTVIMMAAMSGRRNKKAAPEKETVNSLNDYKIIWSKQDKSNTTVATKCKTAFID